VIPELVPVITIRLRIPRERIPPTTPTQEPPRRRHCLVAICRGVCGVPLAERRPVLEGHEPGPRRYRCGVTPQAKAEVRYCLPAHEGKPAPPGWRLRPALRRADDGQYSRPSPERRLSRCGDSRVGQPDRIGSPAKVVHMPGLRLPEIPERYAGDSHEWAGRAADSPGGPRVSGSNQTCAPAHLLIAARSTCRRPRSKARHRSSCPARRAPSLRDGERLARSLAGGPSKPN